MFSSLKARHQSVREDGFTLTELAVAVTILGILLAIALPVFLTAQKHVSSLDVKTGLIQSASLIEAEKGDNNQLYPVYMPSEILSDSLWKTFAYTYSDDRLTYCLQGRDSDGGKWFVSSANRTPSATNCGQPNVAKNSDTPWQIQFPAVDVSTYALEWKANASNPNGKITWAGAQCNEGTTSYQLRIVNTTQGIDTKVPTDSQISANNAGLSTISYEPNLAGWLPDDQTSVSVAAICTEETGGRLYTFIGPYTGAVKNAAVPQFPVTAASYSSAPAAYYTANADNSLTMKVDVTFTGVSCPTLTSGVIGTNHPVYELIAKQAGKSDVGKGSFSTSPNFTRTLTGFAPDTTITYEGRSYCEFTRTSGAISRYSGTDVTDASKDGHATTSEYSPVGFPSAPGTPTTVSTNGNSVSPDGLTWNAPSARGCMYGGTIQYSYVQSSPGSSASAYSAATASGRINWAEATSYTYYINAKCVGSNRTSDVTASASVSFTTSSLTPAASWAQQYTTSYGSDQLVASGSLNTITCPNNSQPRYKVTASQAGENDVVADGSSTNPSLTLNTTKSPSYGYDGDKLVTFTGVAYCRVTQYDGTSTKDWPGTSATSSQYAAVAKPAGTSTPYTSISGNPDVIDNRLNWDGQSCPNGGSIRYRYVQDSPGNSTSSWMTSTYIIDVGWAANTRYYYHIEYFCDASQGANSGVISGGQTTFVTRYNTPNSPGAPTSVYLDDYGPANVTNADRLLWAGVGCGRNSTPYYIVRQVRTGGNYANPDGGGYNGTDWFTNTYLDLPAGWLRQGSQQGYQVIAQCRNSTGTSGNSGWSGEAYNTHNIDQPGAVGLNRYSDRGTNWGGVGCGQGAYTQYLWQQYNHNEGTTAYGSAFDRGWGDYYSSDVDGYNGYAQGVRVYTRCVGDNAISGNSESNHIDYRIPVYAPRMQLDCKPNYATKYGGGSASCDGYKVAFNPGCGNSERANYAWNGTNLAGSGVTVTGATSGSSANTSNNGAFQRSGKAGVAWGNSYTASINGAYCQAGNGQNSGGTNWSINNNTAGGTWNTGNYF